MSTVEISPEVQKGITFLDEKEPGWANRIDLDDFNMAYCHACVLGQLLGDLNHAHTEWFGDLSNTEFCSWTVSHGFDVWWANRENYPVLAKQWVQVILERQNAAKGKK